MILTTKGQIEIKIVVVDGRKMLEIHAPLLRRNLNLLNRWYSMDYPDSKIIADAEEFIKINYL